MTLTQEDLQAISTLMDEKLNDKLNPISKRLDGLESKLETMEIKQDILTRKFDDINFRVTSIEYNNKIEFGKINDEIETLIAVLEAKDILPKHA